MRSSFANPGVRKSWQPFLITLQPRHREKGVVMAGYQVVEDEFDAGASGRGYRLLRITGAVIGRPLTETPCHSHLGRGLHKLGPHQRDDSTRIACRQMTI